MDHPKWLPSTYRALLAIVLVGFVNHFAGIIGGNLGEALMGCTITAFGAVFLLGGIFGREFSFGDGGDGPPAPRALVAPIFIAVGGLFILFGSMELFHSLI